MNDSLTQFAGDYGDNGTRISKFKKYRERYSASAFVGIILLIATLFQGYQSLFQGFPYPDYLQLVPGVALLAIGIIIYLGKRDMDIGTEDITYYEIASAIEAKERNDIENTLHHIQELKKEVNRNSNGMFSEQSANRIESYYERLDESQNPEGILNDSFEDFFENLIQELSEENEMDQILRDISTDTNEEFEGSVLMDSIKRIHLDLWSALTIIAVLGSLLVFNIVGKDSGYYVGILSLTVIQILSERRD